MSFEQHEINPDFAGLFSFKSENDELKHDAKILMYRFLSEIERLNEEKGLQKKDFASAIKTSRSFVTQLFKGDKLMNFVTAAKLQKAFGVTFHIEAIPNKENSLELDVNEKNVKSTRGKVIPMQPSFNALTYTI